MGAAYSVDLRSRVLEALDAGMSKMEAHRTFSVARSTIDDWLALRAKTGQLQALPHRRHGRAPLIHDLEKFEDFARRHCHKTLEQMTGAWFEETGHKLSAMPFSDAMKRIGWTRKKSAGSTVSVWAPATP